MLAPGNYVKWKSRIKRYIDTKLNHELIHFCLKNPPYIYKFLTTDANSTLVTPGNEGTSQQQQRGEIILTRINNDIYSTVDAYPNTIEMWKAIERLKQGNSINVQDLETVLYWEFGKFTSQEVNVQFILQLKPEWQRFVTIVKQSQDLKNVSYYKIYDILKQHKNEVNEIRAERLACTANPLALIAQQQLVYHPQTHTTHYIKVHQQDHKLLPETEEKEIHKLMALISMYFNKIYKPTNNILRTSSNSRNTNVDNSLKTNRGTGNLEVTPDSANNSRPIFDAEPLKKVHNSDDDYNVFANERQHPKQPESDNDTYLMEQGDTNITYDSLDMSNNREEADQDDQMLKKERELLAFLIDQMKIEIDGSKQHNKTLESSNKALKEANTFLQSELTRCQDTNFVKMLMKDVHQLMVYLKNKKSNLKNLLVRILRKY
ncbi:hypothetical protein Tco_1248927 [Tanacetum coccineum]